MGGEAEEVPVPLLRVPEEDVLDDRAPWLRVHRSSSRYRRCSSTTVTPADPLGPNAPR